MNVKFFTKFIICLLIFSSITGCTEPFQMQTSTFEDALVIEATITNEVKKQQIKISRTYQFEDNGPVFETGADVYIEDEAGNQYQFTEQNGIYESISEFQAIPGKEYQLFITTADNREYTSTREMLTTVNEIESINTNITTNDNGQRGVQISVTNYDPTNTSKYYRYEYEETHKIIVPYWSSYKAVIRFDQTTQEPYIDIIPRDHETRICYTTKKNTDIILTNTSELSEDRVVDFPVRFINDDDFIITNRYSILVKQYIQSLEAHIFYKKLKELSESGNILSPNQPGFFSGNIKSTSNSKEKVIGYFDVSSVSSKRIFFNYNDIFPGEPLPAYFTECNIREYNALDNNPISSNGFLALATSIRSNTLIFYNRSGTVYQMVIPQCGDCTSFSSNVIPPFWQ